jgi:hypothetical protein
MEYSNNLGSSNVQGVLVSSLNSKIYNSNDNKINVEFQPNGSFYSSLADDNNNNNNKNDLLDSSNNEESNNKNDIFGYVNNPINTFFIGSITVVGLFVLFRLLQKNK